MLSQLEQSVTNLSTSPAWTVEEADDLRRFAPAYLWILDKQKQRRPFALNRAQRHYLKNRTRRDLILKSRQLGFSTLIQGDWLRLAVTRSVGTLTLAHNDDTTQRLRRMADFFYHNLPEPKPKRKYANAAVTTYESLNSEAAIGTAGNTSIGRGFTSTHIHASEVAFWPDADAIMAGAMQGGDPVIAAECTPNGAQGWFYERCMEALDGNADWRLHFYPWWWEEKYQLALTPDEELTLSDEELALIEKHQLAVEQIKWRRAKQRDLKHLFLQEYPEDPINCFLLSGTGYFGALDGVFTAPQGAEPQEGHIYYGGLDFGQSNDYTVLSIFDWTTKQQVYLLRINRMLWSEMRRQVVTACVKFGVKVLYAERNSASTNIEELQKEFPRTRPFDTTADTKQRGLAVMHEALNENGWKLLNIPEQVREMRAFAAKQSPLTGRWSFSAPDGEHDDIVMANMLALHGALRPPIVPGVLLDA